MAIVSPFFSNDLTLTHRRNYFIMMMLLVLKFPVSLLASCIQVLIFVRIVVLGAIFRVFLLDCMLNCFGVLFTWKKEAKMHILFSIYSRNARQILSVNRAQLSNHDDVDVNVVAEASVNAKR